MGRDKATLPFPGPGARTTMLQRTVEVLSDRCAPVLVVAAPGQRLPDVAAQLLRDDRPGQGPLPATAVGLRAAAAAGRDWAFVCAVDMPRLAPALIAELLTAAADPDVEVVLPWDGREHYLAALYRTALAGRIDALVAAGERRIGAVAASASVRRVSLSDPGMLANVNTAEQYRAADRLP